MMVAKTASLVVWLQVLDAEKVESRLIAVDWKSIANAFSFGNWKRNWFAEDASKAYRTKSRSQAKGSKSDL